MPKHRCLQVPLATNCIQDEPPAFEPFMRLPPELRLKIWKWVDARNETNVEVIVEDGAYDPVTDSIVPRFKLLTPLPVTLSICPQSRLECLKNYLPAFQGYNGRNVSIYINPKTDTLSVRIPVWDCDWMLATIAFCSASDKPKFMDPSLSPLFDPKTSTMNIITPCTEEGRSFLNEEVIVIVRNASESATTLEQQSENVAKASKVALNKMGVEKYNSRFVAYQGVPAHRILGGWSAMWKDLFDHLQVRSSDRWHWHGPHGPQT